ncbi:MAG: hypothetical protein HRT72_13520 [Flavobacteriales bacterium]|nr:hypothetical protein [Flavobacteriales bacterium]
MKKHALFITTLLMLTLTFNSCKKEQGCTDSSAYNYNSLAEEDDGSCSHYTKAKIQFVTLESFSTVNDLGETWDTSSIADPYIQIQDENHNILYQTDSYSNFAPPITWEVSPNVTIDNIDTSVLWLYVYDEDGTVDNYIGLTSIYLSDYTSSNSNEIEETFAGTTFKILVQWLE